MFYLGEYFWNFEVEGGHCMNMKRKWFFVFLFCLSINVWGQTYYTPPFPDWVQDTIDYYNGRLPHYSIQYGYEDLLPAAINQCFWRYMTNNSVEIIQYLGFTLTNKGIYYQKMYNDSYYLSHGDRDYFTSRYKLHSWKRMVVSR